jgi:hypothetical protein
VAYSRASQQLHVVTKSTPGVRVEGQTWVNPKLGIELKDLDIYAVNEVHLKIADLAPHKLPSVRHLSCVLNPSYAAKSAKGWTLK